MKIAILTSGILPVPAVQGGAVENLLDFVLEYNNKHQLHDITVYSVFHPKVSNHPALLSKANHYYYLNSTNLWAKISKRLKRFMKVKGYYDENIEYYLSWTIRQIKKNSFDLIIIENRPGYVLRLKNETKTPLVIHQENDYLNSSIEQSHEIYNATSRIINTSDYITRRVQTINPLDKKSITVLNGIDLEYYYKSKTMNRKEIGLDEKDFVIVYSGRLTPEKGILPLIQSIKRIKKTEIKLLIIGANAYGQDQHPTPFIQQLQKESNPIKDNIIFTGYINYEHIPAYLKMADIAIVPSMWEEPFGLTVVEALAAGLPLIATNSGGIPEICAGVATIINRDNIVSNITSAILDLYEHPEKRRAMSEAALKRSKLFSKERYAREFFEALETTT